MLGTWPFKEAWMQEGYVFHSKVLLSLPASSEVRASTACQAILFEARVMSNAFPLGADDNYSI